MPLATLKAAARTPAERKAVAAYALQRARSHPADLAPMILMTDDGRPMEAMGFHREWVDACVDQSIRRLLILAARGHAKSEWVGGVLPPYELGSAPRQRILLISSTDDMAKRFTRQLKRVLLSPMFNAVFPNFPGIWQANDHEIYLNVGNRDPSFKSAGWGTTVTGTRADLIILEDCVTREHATSRAIREAFKDYLNTTLRPILVPGGRIIAVGTPYHEDDGWAMLEARGYRKLVYPSEFADGRILWPERFSREELDQILLEIGEIAYTTQYKCQAVATKGEVFQDEWFELLEDSPRDGTGRSQLDGLWWAWDTAISKKTSADYTAGGLAGICPGDGRAVLVDVRRGQWEPQQAKRAIKDAWMESRTAWGSLVKGILIEDTKEGRVFKAWFDEDPEMRSVPVILTPHEGLDKYARASLVAPTCEARKVRLLNRSWTEAFLLELKRFTSDGRHAHDDQVDFFVYLLARLFGLELKPAQDKRTVLTARAVRDTRYY